MVAKWLILQTSDLGVHVQAFPLDKKCCRTLLSLIFTRSVGRTDNYPLKGGGRGVDDSLLTEGYSCKSCPCHTSYWLKLTFYLVLMLYLFNYKGMVSIHIH